MEKLLKCPVYQYYWLYASEKHLKNINDDDLSKINYGARHSFYADPKTSNYFKVCILYPGYEKLIKKVVNLRNKYADSLNEQDLQNEEGWIKNYRGDQLKLLKSYIDRQPMVIFPPDKNISEKDILSINKKIFIERKKNSTQTISYKKIFMDTLKHIPEVQREAMYYYVFCHEKELEYDERSLHRIFAILDFCKSETNNKTTLKEYVETHNSKIIELCADKDYSLINTENLEFAKKYFQKKNILAYIKRSLKKNEEIIYGFTLEEIKKIMTLESKVSEQNYSRSLLSVVKDLKNMDNLYSEQELQNKLEKYLPESVFKQAENNEHNNIIAPLPEYIEKFIQSGRTKNLYAKTNIVKFIEKNNKELSIMNTIVLTNHDILQKVFRGADQDKIFEIIDLALNHYEEPINFVRFITQLFFAETSHIASYAEWKRYINDSEKDDTFDLPPSFLISFMVSRETTDKVYSSNNIIYDDNNMKIKSLQDKFKKYAISEDL